MRTTTRRTARNSRLFRMAFLLLISALALVACSDSNEATDGDADGDLEVSDPDGDHDDPLSDGDNDFAGDGDENGDTEPVIPGAELSYSEDREACANRNPLRNVYFGDLHAHTEWSWDARGYDVRTSLAAAWAFAKGTEPVQLSPLDANGVGTRDYPNPRPLDFAGLTDHLEYVGEVWLCLDAQSEVYATERCAKLRDGGQGNVTLFGMKLATEAPDRYADICGDDGARCRQAAAAVWSTMQDEAEAAYDRTSACEFTSFIGYEYTASPAVVNMHRNVIFKNTDVPALPPSLFEAESPQALWEQLQNDCIDAATGCDVMVLPHNSNWSNGNLYSPYYDLDGRLEKQQAAARTRLAMEHVVEIFQHKGDMECKNGFDGIPDDPFCSFEKIREADFVDCGEGTGSGGANSFGCISRLDFLRNVFLFGLAQRRTLGFNPYKVGVIGSTDTHNGIPGGVEEASFPGHVGNVDDSPQKRLGPGTNTHQPRVYNPGGLAAVWAVENSRDAIFEAFSRGEVYATSGPRIKLRSFAGAGLPADWCERDDRLTRGYLDGVPMGGTLNAADGAPLVAVEVEMDAGTDELPGARLMLVQLVIGRIDVSGNTSYEIVDLAGELTPKTAVDPASCAAADGGMEQVCVTYRDQNASADTDAFYYIRVLQQPTCRWSSYDCLRLAADGGEPPEFCQRPIDERIIYERAWSSPIWVEAP